MDKENFFKDLSTFGKDRNSETFWEKKPFFGKSIFGGLFENFDLGHGEFSMVMRLVISNEREKDHLIKLLDEKENTPEKQQERQEKLGELIKKAIKEPLSVAELVDLQNCLHKGANIHATDKETNRTLLNLAWDTEPKIKYAEYSETFDKMLDKEFPGLTEKMSAFRKIMNKQDQNEDTTPKKSFKS